MVIEKLAVTLAFVFLSAILKTSSASAEDLPRAEGEDFASGSIADPFEMPVDASPEGLLKFIDGLSTWKPHGANRQEQLENLKKAYSAMLSAADRIIASRPDENVRATAFKSKIQTLTRLMEIGDGEAEAKLTALADHLKEDPNPELAKRAGSIPFQLRAHEVMRGNIQGAAALLSEVPALLAATPDDLSPVRTAVKFTPMLEFTGKVDKAAVQAYRDIALELSRSADPRAARYATLTAGIARRLELVGNPITISGTLLSGDKFEPLSLQGKVVLVDFWATWCGPCVAEIPDVLDYYKKYHDRGFEVVGISLDTDREALEQFLKEQKIPWPILFEAQADEQGWTSPMAARYGITGIPAMILIGADGKVVSLAARGKLLGKMLEKELGPAPESPETASEAEPSDDQSSP